MDLKRITDKAKQALDEHGGVDGLKAGAARVRDAASKPGSVKDKAAAARDALKQPPTSADPGTPQAPVVPDAPMDEAAAQTKEKADPGSS